jgi:ribosome biogenesis GTPase / thiamine phosphate phosphatase
MNLEVLGWNERRQREFSAYAAGGLLPGRVVGEHRSHYRVATEAAELTAAATGRIRKAAEQRSDLPGVGDFVAVRLAEGDGPATIEAVLPRTTVLVRKAAGEQRPQLLAANIDVVFIVTAADGDFNLARIERYLALVRESGADPVVVLNKSDLIHDVNGPTSQIAVMAPGVPVHIISARNLESIQGIERYFADNRTIVLIGSSGVGKSTLTNQLLGRAAQATQEVRGHDSRGRHTTTHRQLFTRPQGGALIDTPGLRGLELWNAPISVEAKFDDIEALAVQCRFRDCRHDREPGCAVRAAVERGDLDAERLAKAMGTSSQGRPGSHRERR